MIRNPGSGAVRIKLAGLMLSRYVGLSGETSAFYEAAILRAPGHRFTICYEVRLLDRTLVHAAQMAAPEEDYWTLGVRDWLSDTQLFMDTGTDFNRILLAQQLCNGVPHDHPVRLDFRWVPDLVGNEFPEHPKTLELDCRKLHPVIKFPNGIVFTEKLSPVAVRSFDGGGPQPFGVLADIIGIDIDAKPGNQIVLRNEKTGEGKLVATVEPDRQIFIYINNTPPMNGVGHSGTHFGLYYNAIKNVVKKYDIEVAALPGQPAPHRHAMSDVSTNTEAQPSETPVCRGGSAGGGAPLCGGAHVGGHGVVF